MSFTTRSAMIVTEATTTQALPENAVEVVSVVGLAGGATSVDATSYTVQSAALTADTQVQFTGTANAPSEILTFDEALAANGILFVTYIPVGAIPASI